jgi:hypothetical protein
VIAAVSTAGEPDDDVIEDEVPEAAQVNRVARAALNVASADRQAGLKKLDAFAMRDNLDFLLRQRIALIVRVCGLNDMQQDKLQLAAHGDTARFLDRIADLRTQLQLAEDDRDEVRALHLTIQPLLGHFIQLTGDATLSVKVMEQFLTAEQRPKLRALQEISRMGGQVQTWQSGSPEGLEIFLRGTNLPDQGLAILSELPNVVVLHLDGTRGTDAAMAQLSGLADLRRLRLHDSSVTDAGLLHVREMMKLESLSLNNTRVTDSGLAHLRKLSRLSGLSLDKTQVSDTGLAHLTGLAKLELLSLRSTQVTDAGIAELRDALPRTQIVQ